MDTANVCESRNLVCNITTAAVCAYFCQPFQQKTLGYRRDSWSLWYWESLFRIHEQNQSETIPFLGLVCANMNKLITHKHLFDFVLCWPSLGKAFVPAFMYIISKQFRGRTYFLKKCQSRLLFVRNHRIILCCTWYFVI